MTIVFPGEPGPPLKPDLETIESFDNSQVGGLEKFGGLTTTDASVGGLILGRVATAGNYTVLGAVIVGVTSTAAARTITLATSATEDGKVIIVKDESGAANVNNITIDTEGSELIDGAASKTINTAYGVKRFYSDGSNWFEF